MAKPIPRKNAQGQIIGWQIQVRKKGFPSQSRTFRLKAEAERWAAEISSEMSARRWVDLSMAESMRVSEALQRYIDEEVPNRAHPEKERVRATNLKKRQFAQHSLVSLRGADLTAFVKEREREGVSPSTIQKDLAIVSAMYTAATRDWGFEGLGNPVKNCRKPKSAPGRDRRLSCEKDEENRLKRAAAEIKPEMGGIIDLALATAMRCGEIAGMTWENVRLSERYVHLPKTKNGTSRNVPLSTHAVATLKAMGPKESGRVVDLSAERISKFFTKICRQANIPDLTFHDLRHEAISRLVENPRLGMLEVMEISGHKSTQMLKRYAHLKRDYLADKLG